MSTSKTLFKSSFFRAINTVLQVLIAFVMTPLIIHSLGTPLFGLWSLIGAFIGYYGLLDLGLSSAVTRFVSRAIGKKDNEIINTTITTSLGLFSLAGLGVILVTITVAFLAPLFIKEIANIVLFRKVIFILGISMAISFPMRVFEGVLQAFSRYDLAANINLFRLISSNLLIYYVLTHGQGLLSMALITFITTMLSHLMRLIRARQVFPAIAIKREYFKKEHVMELYGYSGKTFVAAIADILRFKVDTFVISIFLGLSMITPYAIAMRLVNYFTKFIQDALGIMQPIYSKYEGQGDFDKIRKIFFQVSRFSVILSVYIGGSIVFYGGVFIQRWLGPGFEGTYLILVILAIPTTVELMQNPSLGLMYGISKHGYYAIANTCEGILNLVLSLILVRHYGVYGVALGTAIEILIFKLFIQPIFTCHAAKLSVWEYYGKTLVGTSIKCLIPLSIYFVLTKPLLTASFSKILLQSGLQLIIFVPLFFFLVLKKEDRLLLRKVINKS